jgi:hypothetical protein
MSTVTKHLKSVVAAMALSVVFAVPAFAEGNGFNDGFVTLFMKNGGFMQKALPDPKLLAELVKGGTEISPGSMVVMYNGKTYLVHDAKMASGTMMSEIVMNYR